MKKFGLITFILFIPILLFAQSDGAGAIIGYLLLYAFGFAIAFVIFLALRSVVLWYWKVYDIIKNQELQIYEQKQTNYLLETQNELLNKLLGNKTDKV